MQKIQDTNVPVIAIDGGAGTGKSTIRQVVATHLGFHELDSGVLYRAVALRCNSIGIGPTNTIGIINHAKSLNLEFRGARVFLDEEDVTLELRTEQVSELASIVARISEVRVVLRSFQLDMRKLPGLVADGRDMGEIFEPALRFFLQADPEVRARRRICQLREAGVHGNYSEVLSAIKARDHADQTRTISPLVRHPKAMVIDTTKLSISAVSKRILKEYLFKGSS